MSFSDFSLPKKTVRIMAATQPRNSYRILFKKINVAVYLRNYVILPVPCPYLPSLMNVIASNPENVQTN